MVKRTKRILIATGLILLLLIALPFYWDSVRDEFDVPLNKQLEIKDSTIFGYKDAQLTWRISAEYIWAGRSKYLFRAENIQSGDLFNSKGELVLSEISAKNLRVNTKSKTLSAYESIKANLIKRKKSKKRFGTLEASEDDRVRIKANELRYFSSNKRTYLSKDVSIKQGDSTIYPLNGVEVDNETNIAYVEFQFRMESDDFIVTGNQMEIYIDDEYSTMRDIVGLREGKPTKDPQVDEREQRLSAVNTYLKADQMTYHSTKDEEEIYITGNISVSQYDKKITSDYGFYSKKDDLFILEGNVNLEADSLGWLLTASQSQFSNEDMQDTVKMAVQVSANKLVFNAKEKILKLIGDVTINQPDKKIQCDKFIFNDKTNTVSLVGSVKVIKDDEDTIQCERLHINIKEESFFADQGVLTEFIIKKNKI